MNTLESYFDPFRRNIIGRNASFLSPYGEKRILYADWTASGRMYGPIEQRLIDDVLPLVSNTHSKTTATGSAMTHAYEEAKKIIKQHVNAHSDDLLIFCGSGMTAAVNKLQRLLGLRMSERTLDYSRRTPVDPQCDVQQMKEHIDHFLDIDEQKRPVVFCTNMEHHSNHTSWMECIVDLVLIQQNADGNVDLDHLRRLLEQYKHRTTKIAAVTACSNVTGIHTPVHDVAEIMHENGGYCFADYACSAPYVRVDMHPADRPLAGLDAIMFSPHKFLGGPGTPGVLIFNAKLYTNKIPDQPGGGTVIFVSPWDVREYFSDIETREDGGTPPFLQGIKAAMAVKLKEEMGIDNIMAREEEIVEHVFARLDKIPNITVLESRQRHRLAIFSFLVEGMHNNLIVKILNDRFGVQARSGWSCAGAYGHELLDIDRRESEHILDEIRKGNKYIKPGWARVSFHPCMTDAEIDEVLDAIEQLARNAQAWSSEYVYQADTNETLYPGFKSNESALIHDWFSRSFRS